MKVEGWLFAAGFFFFAISAVIYGLLAEEPVGTVALAFTAGLSFLIGYYLLFTARRIDPRPEDSKVAEIAEGAGELGFFPPSSKWPLFLSLTFVLVVIAPIYGWWLMIIGFGFGFITLTGLLYEFYRGDHAH
jgi:hypothetical protein